MSAGRATAVAFVCPWCPVTVVGLGDAADDARRLIEHHLDEHLTRRPSVAIPEPRQPPASSTATPATTTTASRHHAAA